MILVLRVAALLCLFGSLLALVRFVFKDFLFWGVGFTCCGLA